MLREFYRLTKPERTFTNVITASAGYLFASKWHIDWRTFAALLVGSSLIIASACVLNNFIDRDMDQLMARTKKRALVTGKISTRSAIVFAAVLALLGFWVLTFTNWLTFGIGAAAFVSYVVLYDIAKRYSVHGTLVGTVPGAASLVAGYTAVTNRLDEAALLLFIIMAAWQTAHFYAIAIYRLKDYQAAHVPVWPARYGVKNTKIWILIYIALFAAAASLLSVFGYAGLTYRVIVLLLAGYWLLRGVRGFRSGTDDKWARSMFGISLVVLLSFCCILALGPILP